MLTVSLSLPQPLYSRMGDDFALAIVRVIFILLVVPIPIPIPTITIDRTLKATRKLKLAPELAGQASLACIGTRPTTL